MRPADQLRDRPAALPDGPGFPASAPPDPILRTVKEGGDRLDGTDDILGHLKVSPWTLRKYRAAGCPIGVVDGRLIALASELDAWLASYLRRALDGGAHGRNTNDTRTTQETTRGGTK